MPFETENGDAGAKSRYATTKSGVCVRVVPPVELDSESKASVLRIIKWEDDSAQQAASQTAP